MTVQSNAGIWIALRDEIRNWMSANNYGDAVYVAEKPGDEMLAQYAVQIIPSGDAALHPRSGVGLLESTI